MPVLGGASGALIIEGIERANRQLGGLPERVFIVRDQELLHPDAHPSTGSSVPPPPVLRDPEGDILNTGTGAESDRRISPSILYRYRIRIIRLALSP